MGDLEGMIITSSFHDSDWISISSYACRCFRVSTAIMLSRMPLNELGGGWEVVVCGTKRRQVPLFQILVICKSADVY